MGIKTIRVALACNTSDIPATRKICGFYGFKAKCGCSKCLKEFLTKESTDYSGFQRDEWQLRDIKTHRTKALEAKNATTAAAQEKIQQEIGVRHSELLELKYFDIVRYHMIDAMHNLFLGTAKNVWKTRGIFM